MIHVWIAVLAATAQPASLSHTHLLHGGRSGLPHSEAILLRKLSGESPAVPPADAQSAEHLDRSSSRAPTRAVDPDSGPRRTAAANLLMEPVSPTFSVLQCAENSKCEHPLTLSDLDRDACAVHCAHNSGYALFAHASVGHDRCQCFERCATVISDSHFSIYSSAGTCHVAAPRPTAGDLGQPVFYGSLIEELAASSTARADVPQQRPHSSRSYLMLTSFSFGAHPGWRGSGHRMSTMQLILFISNAAVAVCLTGLAVAWLMSAWNRRRSAQELRMLMETACTALRSPPALAVVLPVKGAHSQTADNWTAQLTQHGYRGKVTFVFVVQEETDPAYTLLQKLLAQGSLPTHNVRVLVAGLSQHTSQKLHNMIYAIERVDEDAELVLMLDDDMLMAPGAVDLLAHDLLSDPSLLAASGFSYDVPGRWSPVTHAACIFRLLLEVSVSTGGASAAWGGCCMMRKADLLDTVPDGVMQHWKNHGYSDDWIITQVARRQNRRISNPPLLFLNLVEFSTLKQVYNFLHRQFFVLDTYVQPRPGESPHPFADPHRRESYLLALLQAACGVIFTIGVPLMFAQMYSIVALVASHGVDAVAFGRPDVLSLAYGLCVAAPLCLTGAALTVRMQARCACSLSPDVRGTLASSGHYSLLLAPLGFYIYTAMAFFFVWQGILGSSVVWSGARYFKRSGRVDRIERELQMHSKLLKAPNDTASGNLSLASNLSEPPLVCDESSDDSSETSDCFGRRRRNSHTSIERARGRSSPYGRNVSIKCS